MSTYLPTVFGENLFDVFDDFDRDFFRGFGRPEHVLYGKNASRLMKTDVKETDEGYEVDVDLPGFNKDEIKLDLNNGYLTISTEKSLNKENKGKMLRQERYVGTMQRSFYVGESITEDGHGCGGRKPHEERGHVALPGMALQPWAVHYTRPPGV